MPYFCALFVEAPRVSLVSLHSLPKSQLTKVTHSLRLCLSKIPAPPGSCHTGIFFFSNHRVTEILHIRPGNSVVILRLNLRCPPLPCRTSHEVLCAKRIWNPASLYVHGLIPLVDPLGRLRTIHQDARNSRHYSALRPDTDLTRARVLPSSPPSPANRISVEAPSWLLRPWCGFIAREHSRRDLLVMLDLALACTSWDTPSIEPDTRLTTHSPTHPIRWHLVYQS